MLLISKEYLFTSSIILTFYIGKISIYSAMFSEIFVQIWSFS